MKFFNILAILFISVYLLSCESDDNTDSINPLQGYTKLSEGYAIGASAKVELWGIKNYFVGYNNLKVLLYDSITLNQKITDASITFSPLMTMDMGNGSIMTHSSPIENPLEAVDDIFSGAVVFTMPTNATGFWQLSLNIANNLVSKSGIAKFDVVVENPDESVLSVFTTDAPDQSKLILSLLQPTNPKVGMNDIEFTIHKKASMMSFPANDGYVIEITPEMPSMDHGSPNNVNPVNIGNGHYKGSVNFTMTGEWRINVVIKKDGAIVYDDAYFIIQV